MNRFDHLKMTLWDNMVNNLDYPNIEFIILDYNSSDGLENWIVKAFPVQLNTGVLRYYKTLNKQYLVKSHALNVAFKLADGDVICNVDADNFIGSGFAWYVNHKFLHAENIFLSANATRDVLGRICVKRDDFYRIRGYDEKIHGYGFEDIDFKYRLAKIGKREITISEPEYLKAIKHGDKNRVVNELAYINLGFILISMRNPFNTEIVFFFIDGSFAKGSVIDTQARDSLSIDNLINFNKRNYKFELENNVWIKGSWKYNSSLILRTSQKTTIISPVSENQFKDVTNSSSYVRIVSPDKIVELCLFYLEITNRIIFQSNKERGIAIVNPMSFGSDLVYKNSNYNDPIIV